MSTEKELESNIPDKTREPKGRRKSGKSSASPVVIVQANELAQAPVTSQGGSLVGDALHVAAITQNAVSAHMHVIIAKNRSLCNHHSSLGLTKVVAEQNS